MKKLLPIAFTFLSIWTFGQENFRYRSATVEGWDVIKFEVKVDGKWVEIDENQGNCEYRAAEDIPQNKLSIPVEPIEGELFEVIQWTYLDDECFYVFQSSEGPAGIEYWVEKYCGDVQFDEQYNHEYVWSSAD